LQKVLWAGGLQDRPGCNKLTFLREKVRHVMTVFFLNTNVKAAGCRVSTAGFPVGAHI